MTPERTQAALAFARWTASELGKKVLNERSMQDATFITVDESESWDVIAEEANGRHVLLAVHRGDERVDIIELVPQKATRQVKPDLHRHATAGMIADVMYTTGAELRSDLINVKKLVVA